MPLKPSRMNVRSVVCVSVVWLCPLIFSGAASSEEALVLAPAATKEQVAREVNFLLAHFFKDPCFAPLRDASQTDMSKLDAESFPDAFYFVPFPESELAHDAFGYSLIVRKVDRVAYLYRSGGFAGVHQALGPVPISICLQPVFEPLALPTAPTSHPKVP